MGISTIITALVGLATGGGLTALVTLRQTREGKDIDNARNLVEDYKDLLNRYKIQAEEATERVEALSDEVTKLRIEVASFQQQLTTAKLLYENAMALKCEVLGCRNRRPPLKKEVLEREMQNQPIATDKPKKKSTKVKKTEA